MKPLPPVVTLGLLLSCWGGTAEAAQNRAQPAAPVTERPGTVAVPLSPAATEERKPARTLVVSSQLVVKPDDVTVLMGYNARLEGTIRHDALNPDNQSATDIDLVYGFTSRDDHMRWTVMVPESAEIGRAHV